VKKLQDNVQYRRVRILKSTHYSFDGKLLFLNINQECSFPELYAASLVSTKAAVYIGEPPPVYEPEPVEPPSEAAEEVEGEEDAKPKRSTKK
jgi:hypothetical protein